MSHAVRAAIVSRITDQRDAGALAHAYLLTSSDHLSLGATARALLAALEGTERLADALIVEPEGASIGIAQARAVREHLATHPAAAPYRTALVLRAELLTPEAQNALLKVAEEPPTQAVLILAAGDESRLLPTLRSRLQRHALPPLSEDEVAAWLAEQGADGSAAGRSRGSLGIAAQLAESTPEREVARALLEAPPARVAAIAKDASAAELGLVPVLRALSLELAYTERTPRTHELWHRVQRLTAAAQASPLSLRLQIAALFADLPA